MKLKVEKAAATGFCFGVRRAIDILERFARERGPVETLGAVVHNQQVLQRLTERSVRVVSSLDEVKAGTVAIGAHGVSPQLEAKMRARFTEVINTTCPFVHRAQIAARRLAGAGFFVIVYGDAGHPEVEGILGWADDRGLATLSKDFIAARSLPRRVGLLSQTTQIPGRFIEFAQGIVQSGLSKDAELRIVDTICHDIRERQEAAFELAKRVNLMLVIGSHTSANTNHLAELCATAARTRLVESAEEIQLSWFQDGYRIGVTGGASTAEETINEVVTRLEAVGQ